MQVLPLNENDMIALSDRAWEIIDPEGLYEADELCWVQELAGELAAQGPLQTSEALRARLAAVCAAVGPAMESVPPNLIAVVMAFLASHPERHHLQDAQMADALEEAARRGEADEQVQRWLAERGATPAPQRRRHPRPEALRHIGARPPRNEND